MKINELFEKWEAAMLTNDGGALDALMLDTEQDSKWPTFSARWWQDRGYGDKVTDTGLPMSMCLRPKSLTVNQTMDVAHNVVGVRIDCIG